MLHLVDIISGPAQGKIRRENVCSLSLENSSSTGMKEKESMKKVRTPLIRLLSCPSFVHLVFLWVPDFRACQVGPVCQDEETDVTARPNAVLLQQARQQQEDLAAFVGSNLLVCLLVFKLIKKRKEE